MRRDTKLALGVAGVLAGLAAADWFAGIGLGPMLMIAVLLALLIAVWNERRNTLVVEPGVKYEHGALIRVRNVGRETIKAVSVSVIRVVAEHPHELVERAEMVPVHLLWPNHAPTIDIGSQHQVELPLLHRTTSGRPDLAGTTLPDAPAHVLTVQVTADNNPAFTQSFRFWRDFRHQSSPWGLEQAGKPHKRTLNPHLEQLAKKHGFPLDQ